MLKIEVFVWFTLNCYSEKMRWGLVRIMLETTSFGTKTLIRHQHFRYQNFADISIFCKKTAFFGKNSTFTQSNSVRAVLEIF